MQKQKLFSLVNIGGFAIGIAACLLISLYIHHETSYNEDIPNKERVFRVVGEAQIGGKKSRGIDFPAPMAKALIGDFPEIEKAGRLMSNELFGGANNQVRRVDQSTSTYETGFCFADTSILEILNIQMLYGSRKQALTAPASVVLCKSLADKYFPQENPVGKTMIFNGHIPVTVGGVMRDFPATSDLQYRGFISLSGLSFGESEQGNWNQSNYSIYLQLRPDVDIQAFNKKISRDIINKYMIPAGKAAGQKNAAAAWKDARLYLQPLTRIHLHSYNIQQDDVSHGDIRFIYLFAAIALIILALACINFLNLSIARASRRAREVGIRKAIGSSRRKLIMQFLTESMLCSILSFLIGGIIARIMLPLFNQVTGVQLDIPWDKWWLFPLLCAATFVIGLLAGLYPAVYLSYFNPVKTLKGNLGRDRKNGSLKARLTIFQFAISIILLIGATVVYRQMQYVLHSNAGFDKDQVLVIKGTDALQSRTAAFRDELLRLPFVSDVSVSDFLPVTDSKRNGNTFHEKGKDEELITTQRWVVDENYIPTLDMKLLAGRNFSTGLLGDSATVIVNKAMADELGYENPIGKVITNGGETLTIIGEVNNFYYENLTQSVKPLIMVAGISNSMISVKLHTTEMSKALLSIRNTWKQFMPAQELRFVFMDDSYAAMYTQLGKVQYIFTAFAILGVVIACLGLFGLSAFMAEQKIKEISIRRVFGANARDLYLLMTSDFVKLILVAILIAVPVAWWCMQTWLEDYVYRIRLSWGIFAWSALAVLVVALFTVSGQALKAIRANPAKNLKIE